MTTAQSFIDYVPKTAKENLAWRVRWAEAALKDTFIQRAIYDAAMEDVLFFINAFGWLIEDRAENKEIPFVTWPHQDPVILAIDKSIDDAQESMLPLSLTLRKSRAQGATYIYIEILKRRFLRDRRFSAGLVTRNEKLVDSMTDKDTVLWKVWRSLETMPYWMLPRGLNLKEHRSLTDHTIFNPDNGASFTGYAATGDVARGGRRTVFVLDEFGSEEFIQSGKDYKVLSSIAYVTNCMWLVSTFGGDTGAFYEAATDPENPLLLMLDWKDNIAQTKNAYVMRNGRPEAVRKEEQAAVTAYINTHQRELKKLERRGHTMEGKFRAPWYDAYCLLPGATPRYIARELDMNPRGAAGKVYDLGVLDRMKELCRPPAWQGKPVFDSETLELVGLIEQKDGPLKLWFKPGVDNAPPPYKFDLGCDISAGGTGPTSSNSTGIGINHHTGEQLVEYAVNGVQATLFGDHMVGLAKWLRKAYLGWEVTGPSGSTFGKQVLEVRNYANVYYREVEEIGSHAKSRKVGWGNFSDKDKAELFERHCISMADGEFLPRSEDMIRECSEYEWENGKIVHRPSKTQGIDEKSHGDRCVGAGVADLLRRDRPAHSIDSGGAAGQNAPVGSIAWHEAQEKKAAQKQGLADFGFSGRRASKLRGVFLGEY